MRSHYQEKKRVLFYQISELPLKSKERSKLLTKFNNMHNGSKDNPMYHDCVIEK